MLIKIELTKPPSVNGMHGTDGSSGRKFLKARVKDWYESAGQQIMQQLSSRETIEGKVRVDMILYTTANDMDNVRKCAYDIIKMPTVTQPYGMGLITDDDMIYEDSGKKIDVSSRKDEKIVMTISGM